MIVKILRSTQAIDHFINEPAGKFMLLCHGIGNTTVILQRYWIGKWNPCYTCTKPARVNTKNEYSFPLVAIIFFAELS